jgi:hypothetical protein
MTEQTQRWLAPMFNALLASEGAAAFLQFMESALTGPRIGDDTTQVTIDWVRLGQLVRKELDWDHYPIDPRDDRATG